MLHLVMNYYKVTYFNNKWKFFRSKILKLLMENCCLVIMTNNSSRNTTQSVSSVQSVAKKRNLWLKKRNLWHPQADSFAKLQNRLQNLRIFKNSIIFASINDFRNSIISLSEASTIQHSKNLHRRRRQFNIQNSTFNIQK